MLRRALLSRRLSMTTTTTTIMSESEPGPMEKSMREKLTLQLRPSELTITNDSWQHRHHTAMKAQGGGNGETHFSVQVVSDVFKGKVTMIITETPNQTLKLVLEMKELHAKASDGLPDTL